MIILLSVLAICITLTILGNFKISEIPIYDKDGKYLAEYQDFSKEDKELIKRFMNKKILVDILNSLVESNIN